MAGQNRANQEDTTMIDPKTLKDVNTPQEIKRVSLEYYKELLTNMKPKAEYVEDLELKRVIHEVRIDEQIENDIEFSQTLFQKSLKMISKKPGNKYKFIVNSGPSLISALFTLFKAVWEQEKKPDLWRNSVLIQLYKGRGSHHDLNMQRNLHTKEEIPKFFGHIVATALIILTFKIILNKLLHKT